MSTRLDLNLAFDLIATGRAELIAEMPQAEYDLRCVGLSVLNAELLRSSES